MAVNTSCPPKTLISNGEHMNSQLPERHFTGRLLIYLLEQQTQNAFTKYDAYLVISQLTHQVSGAKCIPCKITILSGGEHPA